MKKYFYEMLLLLLKKNDGNIYLCYLVNNEKSEFILSGNISFVFFI